MELTPPTALVRRDGETIEIDLNEINTGEIIIIKSGARVPLDGEVSNGSSSINQAPITGESLPVEKSQGDQVFAGTINGEGSLEVTVTGKAGETTLAVCRTFKQSLELTIFRSNGFLLCSSFLSFFEPSYYLGSFPIDSVRIF